MTRTRIGQIYFILTWSHLEIWPSIHPRDPGVLLVQCPRDGCSGSRANPGPAPASVLLPSDDYRPVESDLGKISVDSNPQTTV